MLSVAKEMQRAVLSLELAIDDWGHLGASWVGITPISLCNETLRHCLHFVLYCRKKTFTSQSLFLPLFMLASSSSAPSQSLTSQNRVEMKTRGSCCV